MKKLMVRLNTAIWDVLGKTIRLGLKVKTPFSLFISCLTIPAALVPLLLSKQLQVITDQLVILGSGTDINLYNLVIDLIWLGCLFLTQQGMQYVAAQNMIVDQYRTRTYIKETILRHVCTVRYSYIENQDDFNKRIEFADTYAADEMSFSVQAIFIIVRDLVTFISIAISLWIIHPMLVLVLVITSIPAAILTYTQSDETFRHRTKWMQEGHLNILYYQFCCAADHGLQELRHYGLYTYLKKCWKAIADRFVAKKRRLTVKHLQVNLVADFLHSAVYIVVLLITVWEIYKNPALGLGVFTLVYTLSDRMQKSVGSILVNTMQFASSMAYLHEFFGLEDLEHEEEFPFDDAPKGSGSIVFSNVSFAYPGSDHEVIKNLSITIKPGEKIAIVGDNGSGKTTFVSLLLGLFSPSKGTITIDDLLLEENKQRVRQRISVVFQDFAHYEGTLRENITVSDKKRSLSDEEILELAKLIHVEDVVLKQKERMDCSLGHGSLKGNDLSGGQWQKIALLRAVYRNNADIMILDEPTAALDPIAEADLYRDFAQITGDRTTLLISHRLGITKLVDRILVFRDGDIVESGTHKELMKLKGYYYDMYQAQAMWYRAD